MPPWDSSRWSSWASLPFVLRCGETTAGRMGRAFLFILMSAAAWVGGLFVANVGLLCRLF
jgi:hypothetical protein